MIGDAVTVTRVIEGRELVLKEVKPAQLTALRLFQKASAKKSKEVATNETIPVGERLDMVQEIYDNFNIKALNFLGTMLTDPDDADFLIDVQIAGTHDVNDLLRIFIHGEDETPDDDEDPKPVPARKAVPNPLKKAAAAKKTANDRRTKK